MQPAEQTPIGADTIPQDIGVPPIVLCPGDAEPVAQAVELLGIDRVHHKAPVNQRVDHRSMRYFDRHRNRLCLSGNRQQPIAELRQTRTAVWKFAFADDVALSIHQARMMPLGTPIDTGKPSQCFLRHLRFPKACDTLRACHDAYRYLHWRSRALLPTGHPSWPTRRGTCPSVVLQARV
jgi:hypothetical protein